MSVVWIDFAILAVIGLSSLISLIRGFVKEALSLLTWFAAFFVASNFYGDLAVFFTSIEVIFCSTSSVESVPRLF